MLRTLSLKCSLRFTAWLAGKALDLGDDPASLPKGRTINVGSKDDVSAVKKVGCCSN